MCNFNKNIQRGDYYNESKENSVSYANNGRAYLRCNHQNNNMEESKKTSFSNEKTSDSTTKPSSIVSTAVPTTAIPTTLPTENHNKKEDAPVGYAEANYFKEKVKDIIYYKDGKKHTIAPDTEEGKQIILMAKQRYVNTGEHVLRKNKLKKKVSTLQERGKALEIKICQTVL